MTRWLEVSEKYEGLSEVAGKGSNPIILHWLQVEGKGGASITDDVTPWCGATMAGIFTECGMSDVLPPVPLMARSWLKVGEKLDGPKVGAIVVFPRPPSPDSGHVGLVTKFDDKSLWVRGGNQGDKVCVKRFPRSAAIGYRWPVVMKSPKELSKDSRIAAAARRQQRDQTVGLGTGGTGTAGAATPAPAAPVEVPIQTPATPATVAPTTVPTPKGLRETVDGSLGDVSWAKGVYVTLADFLSFVGHAWPIIAIAIAAYFLLRVYWDGHQIKLWRTEDHNEGYTP